MFAQTLVMTLVSGARSAGQRERCVQKNCKTPALSVVVHMCRYVDVLHTHTCAVTECSFVCTFGSSYRVPETNCVHPFTSSLFSQQERIAPTVERSHGFVAVAACHSAGAVEGHIPATAASDAGATAGATSATATRCSPKRWEREVVTGVELEMIR